MNELSIRIRIADREYPMRVKAEDEERIRQAAKLLQQKLEDYRRQFGLDDKQDLLAMVAFDRMVEQLHEQDHKGAAGDQVAHRLQALSQAIEEAL